LIVNPLPVQITLVKLLIAAVAFTKTVRVNVAFAPQLAVAGVIVYTAVFTELVVFDKVPLINVRLVPVPPADNPELTVGAGQLYVVLTGMIFPFAPVTGETWKVNPLQIVVEIGLMVTIGLTVTTIVKLPSGAQFSELAITVYVAVTGEFVVLDKVP